MNLITTLGVVSILSASMFQPSVSSPSPDSTSPHSTSPSPESPSSEFVRSQGPRVCVPGVVYGMKVDSTLRYRASSSTRGEIALSLAEAEPHRIGLVSEIQMEMEFQFVEVRADSLRVRQKIEWIVLKGQVSGSDYAFDSRQDAKNERGDIYAPLFQNLRAVIGKPLEFEVKDLGRSVRYRPETLQALDSLGGLIQPEDLTGILESVFPPLPKDPILEKGASERFVRPIHIASFGQLDLGCSQQISAVSDTDLELKLEFSPTVTPEEGQNALSDLGEATVRAEKHSGSRRVRLSDGALESSESELELGLGIREQDLKVEGTIKLGSQVERIER